MKIRIEGFEWPTPTLFSLLFLILFILLFITILYIINFIYKKREQKETSWLYILNFALKSNLSFDEILILKSFFYSLSYKKNFYILYEKQRFYKSLFNYLEKQKKISSDIKVKLLYKLFDKNNEEKISIIKSLKDINQGEICNINFSNEHHLGRILAIENSEILVRIPKFLPLSNKEGVKGSIYIYRQNIGGFTIPGNIKKIGDDYIEFKYNGKEIIMDREYYLMVIKKVLFKLISWPQIKENKIEELKKTFPLDSPVNKKNLKESKKNIIINGITEKISERAIGFYFKDENDIEKYKKAPKNIWEINLQLSKDFVFSCRGKIIDPPLIHIGRKPDLFFFRYIDIDEEMHNKLFNFIKENKPKKELLY
jgi:hypothetical protein